MIDVVLALRVVVAVVVGIYAAWRIARRVRQYLPAMSADAKRTIVEAPLLAVLVLFVVVGVPVKPTPEPTPPAPSDASGDLLAKAAPVVVALAGATDDDRRIWAAAWEGAAMIVEAEGETREVVLTNTKELRAFTVAAMDFAWKRLGGVRAGAYPELAAAVESYLADPKILGRDDLPLDAAGRQRYAAAVRALASVGRRRG